VGEENSRYKVIGLMAKIKMVDLLGQYLRIKEDIDSAIANVLLATDFIQGSSVKSFSEALSVYVGGSHTIPCANGTDALQIAMMALDLQAGDEVILPVHTYVATAEVIALLKLKPVFVDVEADTFTIDVNQIESKITSRTKAVVPVHLYGQCANMEAIMSIATKNNLIVIEDAAQALSAVVTFKDGTERYAGTIGHVGTTSFFPSKNLGCFGDGGAMFCNEPKLADKIRIIANHGQRIKYHHEVIGVNSRLDTLQAAILEVKLKHLNEYTQQRQAAASRYDSLLTGIPQVLLPKRVHYSTHVFHQYTVRVTRRDELKKYLEEKGIPSMIYYPVPLHLQKAYQDASYPEGSFPITEELSRTVLSLPIHTEMTSSEIQFVAQSIKDFYA
jgi:UDP-2-acetamido-2-deoxy-ribo-hexuluronate aminotransferase